MVRSRLIARSPVLQIHSHRKKSSDCRWITLFWLQLLAIYESLATVTRIQWSDQSTQKKNCGSTTRAHQFRFTFLALTANSPSTIGQLGSSTCKVNDYFKASTAPFLSPLPFRPLIGATKACRFPFLPPSPTSLSTSTGITLSLSYTLPARPRWCLPRRLLPSPRCGFL